MDMPAAVIVCLAGLAAGYAELRMLSRMTHLISDGEAIRAICILPIKLVILAAVLIPTAFLAPDCLWLAGCAIAASLVIGSFIMAIKNYKKGEEAEQ